MGRPEKPFTDFLSGCRYSQCSMSCPMFESTSARGTFTGRHRQLAWAQVVVMGKLGTLHCSVFLHVWGPCNYTLARVTCSSTGNCRTSVETASKAKQKQGCVMGIDMCLYAQLVQTNNKQSNYITLLSYTHISDFCSQPQLTQPYNHTIYPGVSKIYLVFF